MNWLLYKKGFDAICAWSEYGEPTVDDEALGIEGAEADESSDGAASGCVCCMLFCDVDRIISYLKSCCPLLIISEVKGIESKVAYEPIALGKYGSRLTSSWSKVN